MYLLQSTVYIFGNIQKKKKNLYTYITYYWITYSALGVLERKQDDKKRKYLGSATVLIILEINNIESERFLSDNLHPTTYILERFEGFISAEKNKWKKL